MASLLLLKRKIKTTQNVSKTTKAMQMIAASKLNKAQTATMASRPFAEKITVLAQNVSSKIPDEHKDIYIKGNRSNKTLAIVIGPDKGLCGPMVTNLLRSVVDFDDEFKNSLYIAIGKKPEHGLKVLGSEIMASFDFGTKFPAFESVFPVLDIVNDLYLSEKVGSVKVIYTQFKSVFTQSPQVLPLLPIKLSGDTSKDISHTIFEPSPTEILPKLLRQYIETNIYQYFLENYLSYQAAQMIAMQNATNNARDLIKDLKLIYNKSRQEKITSEILDISFGGATR